MIITTGMPTSYLIHSLNTLALVSNSFFYHDPPPTSIYTLSLHDALPISPVGPGDLLPHPRRLPPSARARCAAPALRSEEHTSELQSPYDLVCRLLLEKKK